MCHESLLVWICSLYLQSQQDIEDLDDEDEVKKLAHHWSDEEFETNYTEQGYEADTEANTHDDWHKGNRVRAADLRQLHEKSKLGLNLLKIKLLEGFSLKYMYAGQTHRNLSTWW